MHYDISDATIDHAKAIAAGNAALALETESKTLDADTLLTGVSRLLEDANRGRYWVATRDGEVIGQIMVTWEWSDWRNGYFWWIQSVYIDASARRQGVFSALYEHVINTAKASGDACGVRLYVERDNAAALSTYNALGMRDAGYHILETLL
ncbi:MAG: GNAT family N-acetyltransferase [Pseudomonadota bacterium]